MAAQTTSEADRQQARASLLERVVVAHGLRLQRDAARYTRCPADADAAFSEGCFRFLSYFQGGDDPEHAFLWLRTAIKHSAIKHRSAELREPPAADFEEDLPSSQDLSPIATEIEHRELLGRLAELKPDQRAALLMLTAGYSYKEIGALRGWTYTKVNRCIAEGRAALRRIEGGEI